MDIEYLKFVAEQFNAGGHCLNVEPIEAGHINDTYLVEFDKNRGTRHYVLQRINHQVFNHPPQVMRNLERVTTHLLDKALAQGYTDLKRRVLTLVPAIDEQVFYVDTNGRYWRCCRFIRDSVCYQQAAEPQQAYQAAYAFGGFQQALADLGGDRLEETIPDFHNTPKRYESFREAIAWNAAGRVEDVREEISFIESRKELVDLFSNYQADGSMPERVVHNDTKINNVLFDAESGEALCVIDLDTVMPGPALFDFGDLVRTATSPVAEDETDLTRVVMRMPMFEALCKGYLEAAGHMLTDCERDHLYLAGRVAALECGMRFLTDHLEGDHYFKIHRPNHNLDRCRAQWALIRSMEAQEAAMRAVVEAVSIPEGQGPSPITSRR